jgi:tetratricopeptide (TPR) repeat protein
MISKTKYGILAVLLVAIFTFSGCKTYEYFTIEVMEPAEIFLPGHIEKILVTHNAYPDYGKPAGTQFTIFGEQLSDTVFRDSTLAAAAIKTLMDMTAEIGRFDFVFDDSVGFSLPDDPGNYNEAHLEKIRKTCRDQNAKAFLILTSLSKKVIYDIYSGDFGSSFGEFQVLFSARWLMIDPFDSKLLDSKTIHDTLFLPVSQPFGRNDEDNYITSIELLNEAARISGLKYGSYISPHFAQTERMIFIKGNRYIKKGYESATEGKWKEAAVYWRDALTVQDDKVRSKATFNLALASEMEGLLEPALGWAKESYRFFPDSINTTYIDILQERIKDQTDIILQMEGRD